MDRSEALSILRGNDLFRSAPLPELQKLVAGAQIHSVPAGSPLFGQQDVQTALFVVLSGRVRIEGVSPDGNALCHRLIRAGEIFGEISLLDGGPRTAAAVACEDCHVLSIEHERALGFLQASPTSAVALARLLAERIRTTSQLLEDAIFLNARDRVGRMLVELARTLGKPLRNGILIEVTHEEIGQRAGLHRVSVTNQLKRLHEEGFVDLDRGLVLIRDVDQLSHLCARSPDPDGPL